MDDAPKLPGEKSNIESGPYIPMSVDAAFEALADRLAKDPEVQAEIEDFLNFLESKGLPRELAGPVIDEVDQIQNTDSGVLQAIKELSADKGGSRPVAITEIVRYVDNLRPEDDIYGLCDALGPRPRRYALHQKIGRLLDAQLLGRGPQGYFAKSEGESTD